MLKKGMVSEMTCAQYKAGQKLMISTVKERDFVDKDLVIGPGMIVKGAIEYSGDETGPWYNFNNIIAVNEQE